MKRYKAAVLTLSDKGARGERIDESGPALTAWLAGYGVKTVRTLILPDQNDLIEEVLIDWSDRAIAELILTTGGTGVAPSDVTPEATSKVVDRLIPGIGELMRLSSLDKTPTAALSRAVAGIRKQSLIINLPGSPKAALENLAAVWPVIDHGIAKMCGDQEDCGRQFSW